MTECWNNGRVSPNTNCNNDGVLLAPWIDICMGDMSVPMYSPDADSTSFVNHCPQLRSMPGHVGLSFTVPVRTDVQIRWPSFLWCHPPREPNVTDTGWRKLWRGGNWHMYSKPFAIGLFEMESVETSSRCTGTFLTRKGLLTMMQLNFYLSSITSHVAKGGFWPGIREEEKVWFKSIDIRPMERHH